VSSNPGLANSRSWVDRHYGECSRSDEYIPVRKPALEFDGARRFCLPANHDGFAGPHRIMEFCGTDNDLLAGTDRLFAQLDRLIKQKDARDDRARGKVTGRCRMIAREPNFVRLPHVSEHAALTHELQDCLAGQLAQAVSL